MTHDEMRFLRREIITPYLIEHVWCKKYGYKASFAELRFWVRMAESMPYDQELKVYTVKS